jgi:hypothetical protein
VDKEKDKENENDEEVGRADPLGNADQALAAVESGLPPLSH